MAYITVTTSNDLDINGIRDMVWEGALDRVRCLSDEELDTIIGILAEEFPDGIDEVKLNDFFWFEDEIYAEWLGWDNVNDFWDDHPEQY